MTIIELTIIIFVIAIGLFAGSLFIKQFGLLGGILGFISGVFLAIFIFKFLLYILTGGRPKFKDAFPICKNPNCCSNKSYKCIKSEKISSVYDCNNCGQKYLLEKGRFMELKSDGTRVPHMRQNLKKGIWEKDNDN